MADGPSSEIFPRNASGVFGHEYKALKPVEHSERTGLPVDTSISAVLLKLERLGEPLIPDFEQNSIVGRELYNITLLREQQKDEHVQFTHSPAFAKYREALDPLREQNLTPNMVEAAKDASIGVAIEAPIQVYEKLLSGDLCDSADDRASTTLLLQAVREGDRFAYESTLEDYKRVTKIARPLFRAMNEKCLRELCQNNQVRVPFNDRDRNDMDWPDDISVFKMLMELYTNVNSQLVFQMS